MPRATRSVPLRPRPGWRVWSAAAFSTASVWPPQRDNEVFRVYGARLLREAAYYPFAVLLELGGFETLIPQFREAAEALLASGLPLLGALKSPAEAEAWRQLYGLGERMTQQTGRLRALIEAAPDTRLIDLDKAPEAEARSVLNAWIEEYAL